MATKNTAVKKTLKIAELPLIRLLIFSRKYDKVRTTLVSVFYNWVGAVPLHILPFSWNT